MTQSGYNFTPGKYDPVKQTDVVEEQAKSNQKILDSENQFLDEMNARDDALVDKTRQEWDGLSNLSSKFKGWLDQKAEKDKKDKLQKGAYLALITPASKEDLKALVDRENGLVDSHLRINEIANRIEETTGSYELAQQFRNMSGWEQYAYVKASLQNAALGYSDFKNEARSTTFIKDDNGNQIGYDSNPNEAQRAQLDAKVRFQFAEQFIGVNEELLSATVGTEILKIDQADATEARNERDANAKENQKRLELNRVKTLFTNDPGQSRDAVDNWIKLNEGTYGGPKGARLALREQVVELVKNGKLSLVKARAMVGHFKYHEGDKKETTIEKWKEFEGFDDELVLANAEWQKKRLDTDTATVKANASALREELESQDTVMSIEQKKAYLKQRNEEFPDVPLNADEQFIIYGYRDDDTMRTILKQKVDSFGGVTELDLKNASPTVRTEFQNNLIPNGNELITSINSLSTDDQKFITDMVSNSAKSTGSLEAKNLQYYALLTSTEEVYVTAYNDAMKVYKNPDKARDMARTAIENAHFKTEGWVDKHSNFIETNEDEEYIRKYAIAQKQMKPENGILGTGGYATTQLEAPEEHKEQLRAWAAAGGKGPVPYYYRGLATDNNILPRELAWRQAEILGYEGQWDEKAELKKFNVPKSMITMFLCKPTGCKWIKFQNEVEVLDKKNKNQFDEEEVNFYEENEDID